MWSSYFCAITKEGRFKEPIARELKAMLEDIEFVPSKQDLLQIIRTYFQGRVSVRPDNKDSRQELASKAVNAFRQMTDSEKQSVYGSLRRSYLRDRKSGLREWADIITNGKDRE
jgi:hypothetical protein